MSERITEEVFLKSLNQLEAMAKGSAAEDIEKSQICTGSGNEPQNWPGGDKSTLGDGWDDNIQPDGTDYNGPGSKARKSIAEKVFKGQSLTPEELLILKGDYDGMNKAKKKKKKHADEEEDEAMMGGEEEEGRKMAPPFEMGKSFEQSIEDNETLQKGIEVSDFLAQLTKSIGIGLAHVEQKITGNIINALSEMQGGQDEFNKSLAGAIVNIGHGVNNGLATQEAIAGQPAGPPRSQIRATPEEMHKSQLEQQGDVMEKADVLDHMTDLVEKGRINSLEVIKFDATGEMSEATQHLVMKSMNAMGQQQ